MSLLPKGYLNCIIAIEQKNLSSVDTFETVATGFLFGIKLNQKNENDEELARIFLATNRHVVQDKEMIYVRFDHPSGIKRYDLPLMNDGVITWASHSNLNIDVAVISINASTLQIDGSIFNWIPEDLMATSQIINSLDIRQGDEIFALGFPLGLNGKFKNYSIARSGIIARLDEEILLNDHVFIIDCNIFPGNSGGPVILKPAITSIEGTQPINKAYLLGMISQYIPYTDVAYSLQTKQPRITFQENSGLATVVPIDKILEIAKELMPPNNHSDLPGQELGEEKNKL